MIVRQQRQALPPGGSHPRCARPNPRGPRDARARGPARAIGVDASVFAAEPETPARDEEQAFVRELDALSLADLEQQTARACRQTLLNLPEEMQRRSLRSATPTLELVARSGPVREGDSPSFCRAHAGPLFRPSGCPARAVARSARHSSARRERVDDAGEPGLACPGAGAEADAASCGQRVRWRPSSASVASCPPDTVIGRAVHGRAHRRTPSRRRAGTAPS